MDALHHLIAELTSGDDRRAEAAAQSLAAAGEIAASALELLLSSPESDTRWWAVRTLAEIPTQQSADKLQQALSDPDAAVRQCAALACGKRRAPSAVPALLQAMHDGDSLTARLAANALVAIGAPAVDALADLLKSAPQSVQLEAARALALIGDPRAIPALFNALDGDSMLLEYWANEGLERMGVGMAFFKPT
jgi:HEAT repeat protein